MPTCECKSIVTLLGRSSRPGLPCARAAVGPYLFHWLMASASNYRFGPWSGPRGIEREAARRRGEVSCPSMHAQVLSHDGVVQSDPPRQAAEHHMARVQNHDVVGEVQRQLDVLFDQHDRKPLTLEPGNGASNVGNDLGSQSLGWLIHQQQS